MNDETREQLSAYLDGALPEGERLELEARLAASAELRGALEDLRSVSRSVRALPKEPLPPGFLSRFQARRARGDAPRKDWVFLPPQARPVVAAMSIGVVALVLWDKATAPSEPELLHPPEAATVYDSANAPAPQLDLSRRASGAPSALDQLSAAKSLQIAGPAPERPRVTDRLAVPEGAAAAAKSSVAAARGSSDALASGRPIAAPPGSADASEPHLTDRTRPLMTEEERSARNEAMFGQLEAQKKKMGIRVLPKSDDADSDGGGMGFLGHGPAAPVVRAPVPSLLKAAKPAGSVAAAAGAPESDEPPPPGPGRYAPDAGLVFSDASSVASSWVILGLPGDPPSTDFSAGRLVIIKPSATKILSVAPGPDAIVVVYRSLLPDEASDPARDRVAPLPLLPKPVRIYDASPR
jgi:hypothetical protein